MKIACVSDIHGMWRQIKYPEADTLVFAGDILGNRSSIPEMDSKLQFQELLEFDKFIGQLSYKNIVFVAGNHDWVFQLNENAKHALTNAHYLQDDGVTIDDIKFYGSPWQPWFYDWAFNFPNHHENFYRSRAHARRIWKQIHDDVDVLVTHGPPLNVLDNTVGGERAGCQYLSERIDKLLNLRAHIFGHIHNGAGQSYYEAVKYVNAAICGENYKPNNLVQVIEVK